MTPTDSGNDRRKLLLAFIGGLAAQLGISRASAQDPAKVMPKAFRVAIENDQVRVLDFVGRPGMGICGEGMHSHPASVFIVMADYEGVVGTPDGAARTVRRKAGDVVWTEGVTHKAENTGKTVSRVMIVELKTPGKA